ncbi:Pkinase-domain-containing protein [Amylocystis lapponica]|nr:Pkinase-domain-containing protein [Amylocystis lapponica]
MDSSASSLQVPDASIPGPSRHQAARPVSVQPTTTASPPQSSTRKRASHQVVTTQPQQEEQPAYRDIYSHPAALEYAAAHPRRTIPKFGPYLLLQTLGEGEFGKVKLGLHMQWGEEVAVKLIRRGNIDSSVRMSKVEREIEVLRTLKHPNIVRLYDVIETDKYIGIILEYASGGELFDHILAHRYLREKDACKLFSQLISGVWYIHQMKIVHRDLKLENLLLDRHRNIIITDFGFANRFEHRSDDLMQTSCGSPCYAAPELVISDGLYVGSAVDIWSCGVILYAMLAGYLPFDDDPANPDGDNINLLYKYIVNTPLSFPEYISTEARDLLSIMLVPDPAQRADLGSIMTHQWLAPYAHTFDKSVADLERAAMDQHHQKRLAYQRQMKQSAVDPNASKISRSHSARTEAYSTGAIGSSPPSRKERYTQPEYLYETSTDQVPNSRRTASSAIVLPTSPPVAVDDDPFAPSPIHESPPIAIPIVASPISNVNGLNAAINGSGMSNNSSVPPHTVAPVNGSPESKRPKSGFRHTIQVEYGESDAKQPQQGSRHVSNGSSSIGRAGSAQERTPKRPSIDTTRSIDKALPSPPSFARQPSTKLPTTPPSAVPPVVSIEVTGPPVTPVVSAEEKVTPGPGSSDSASSNKSRHRKGLSIDKIGISKLFGSGTEQPSNGVARSQSQSQGKSSPVQVPSDDTIGRAAKESHRRPSTLQVPLSAGGADSSVLLSPEANSKKSRRNTLTVMVEPLSRTIKQRSRGRGTPVETPVREKGYMQEKDQPAVPPKLVSEKGMEPPATPQFTNASRTDVGLGMPPSAYKGQRLPASTIKASKVMNWFRSKSKGRPPTDDETEKSLVPGDIQTVQRGQTPSTTSVNAGSTPLFVPTPTAELRSPGAPGHAKRSPSSNTDASVPMPSGGFADRMRRQLPSGKGLRVHHGAVDQTTITTGAPPDVMRHVRAVLEGMGVEIQLESEYKYRCIRPKKRKTGNGVGLGLREGSTSGLAAFSLVGSAASNGVDKRGLPLPSQSHSSFSSTGGMLRGLLMRRHRRRFRTPLASFESEASPEAIIAQRCLAVPFEAIYGDYQEDQGDEVRFSVELTRLDRLDDTFSLDIRRLKGNLRSYKFLYDTLRQRADLQR